MRGIVEEARFAEDLAAIEPDAMRADEFIDGAKWILARDARQGTQVAPDSCVWFLPMNDVPDAPSLILYYTFDQKQVYFLSIQIAP